MAEAADQIDVPEGFAAHRMHEMMAMGLADWSPAQQLVVLAVAGRQFAAAEAILEPIDDHQLEMMFDAADLTPAELVAAGVREHPLAEWSTSLGVSSPTGHVLPEPA